MNRTAKAIITLAIAALAYPIYWIIRVEHRSWNDDIAPGISQILQTSPIEWNGISIAFDDHATYYKEDESKLNFYALKMTDISAFIIIRKVDKMMSAKGFRNWCLSLDDCTLETCTDKDDFNDECVMMERETGGDNSTVVFFPKHNIWYAITGPKEQRIHYQPIIDSLHHALVKTPNDESHQ